MGDTLKQLGFAVMVAENQTRQAFSQTLLQFDATIQPGDTAFFFFAGHGFEIAGQNYLLPIDVPAATEGQEELVRDASILADRVMSRLQNRGARSSILVFDACRNNPFERRGTRAVAGGGGLAPMTQLPEGVFSVFSAGPRQTAAALIRDQRKILDMTATGWLSFREFNGLLVYYTHLMSYRCAIRGVRVGINSAVPDKVLKMPPCDPRDPSAIPLDAQPYLKLAPATRSVSVELT
jgi:hypothetical protein